MNRLLFLAADLLSTSELLAESPHMILNPKGLAKIPKHYYF